MPSPPSSPLPPRRARRPDRSLPAFLLLFAVLAGCATVEERPAPAPLPADAPYLLSPLEGFPEALDPRVGVRLETAWQGLLVRRDVTGAAAVATEILERDPTLAPAQVLAAQVEFREERYPEAVKRLAPIAGRLPEYEAAQLLLGRAAELAGDLVTAYEAYRAVAGRRPVAAGRLEALHPRAIEILENRIDDALRRGRVEEARRWLPRMEAWAPGEMVTLESARRVAAAAGDRALELAALREISSRRPEERPLLERRAELELEVGDPSAGLAILEGLAARHPGDAALERQLARAKFRWRLRVLPERIQGLVGAPELTRAEFAALLYWLVPGARFEQGSGGTIASDILEHELKQEIMRIVNLGVMEVDPTLHQFRPDSPVRRRQALAALLTLLARDRGAPACLGGVSPGARSSSELICRAATRCGLLAEEGECLPQGAVAGAEALEMIHATLPLLGGS